MYEYLNCSVTLPLLHTYICLLKKKIKKLNCFQIYTFLSLYFYFVLLYVRAEEVILAEERTTEAEKMHIMEGELLQKSNMV